MRGDGIAERLIEFAVRVIRLIRELPRDATGRHVAGQLVRAATGAGANYEEARGAESRADFIHKLGIASKEVHEACFWLKIVHRAKLVKQTRLLELMKESEELCAILASSRNTAQKKPNG